MNRNTLLLTASLALTLVAGPALAGPKCTAEAKDKWLSEEVMKQKIADMGFRACLIRKSWCTIVSINIALSKTIARVLDPACRDGSPTRLKII
jgi:hypothetical protein